MNDVNPVQIRKMLEERFLAEHINAKSYSNSEKMQRVLQHLGTLNQAVMPELGDWVVLRDDISTPYPKAMKSPGLVVRILKKPVVNDSRSIPGVNTIIICLCDDGGVCRDYLVDHRFFKKYQLA